MQKLPEPYQSLFEAMLWDCGAEAIPHLVHEGADLSYCDPNTGRTALYAATMSNRTKAVEALLQQGANPNQRFTYRSPVSGTVEADRVALHYASSPEIALALIRAGAEVNAVDPTGLTPLMRAAFNGHTLVVKVLLAAGASPLMRQKKWGGKKQRTARELAEVRVELFRSEAFNSNREVANKRALCYEEIRDLLANAENGTVAT
jgi:ankyrin repeat protein